MEEKLRTELPHRAEPQNQNKQKTQSKLEMSLSLLMKWVTSQVVIIPGTGCEWFSKENEDFFHTFDTFLFRDKSLFILKRNITSEKT